MFGDCKFYIKLHSDINLRLTKVDSGANFDMEINYNSQKIKSEQWI